jgi:hypothetical protein
MPTPSKMAKRNRSLPKNIMIDSSQKSKPDASDKDNLDVVVSKPDQVSNKADETRVNIKEDVPKNKEEEVPKVVSDNKNVDD